MSEALRAAVPADTAFHSERFSPPPIRGGSPFTLRLGAGGPALEVPADRSALQTVREVFPDVAYSCQQGFCNTCHVPLLRGGTVSDTAGPGLMAPCVARAADESVVVEMPGAARAMQRRGPTMRP